MKKTILIFGLISGAISSVLMFAAMRLTDRIGLDKGEYLGYTVIVLSFLLVYFGIRSYRDNVGNGQITFGQAFAVGLGITLISCACYVASWEFISIHYFPDFMDKYSAYMVQKVAASGASAAKIQEKVEEMKKFKEMYANPWINAAMTFIEPFPVGLLITLISSAVLRKKGQEQAAGTPVVAA